MIKKVLLLLIVASATIFSCTNTKQKSEKNETKDDTESPVMQADKIAYSFRASSVAPKYHRSYTITIVENNLHLAINSYGDTLLTKDWTFTKEKFDGVKDNLKDLHSDGSVDESEIPDGGTSQNIRFYKKDKEIFSAEDYRSTKNFRGADIDLSYLIPELKELIASTKTE